MLSNYRALSTERHRPSRPAPVPVAAECAGAAVAACLPGVAAEVSPAAVSEAAADDFLKIILLFPKKGISLQSFPIGKHSGCGAVG